MTTTGVLLLPATEADTNAWSFFDIEMTEYDAETTVRALVKVNLLIFYKSCPTTNNTLVPSDVSCCRSKGTVCENVTLPVKCTRHWEGFRAPLYFPARDFS